MTTLKSKTKIAICLEFNSPEFKIHIIDNTYSFYPVDLDWKCFKKKDFFEEHDYELLSLLTAKTRKSAKVISFSSANESVFKELIERYFNDYNFYVEKGNQLRLLEKVNLKTSVLELHILENISLQTPYIKYKEHYHALELSNVMIFAHQFYLYSENQLFSCDYPTIGKASFVTILEEANDSLWTLEKWKDISRFNELKIIFNKEITAETLNGKHELDTFSHPTKILKFKRMSFKVSSIVSFRYRKDLEVDFRDLSDTAIDPKTKEIVPREINYEKEAMDEIIRAGFYLSGSSLNYNSPNPNVVLNNLVKKNWTVLEETDDKTIFYREITRTEGVLKFNVSSEIDWFDLDAYVDFGKGGRLSLRELLPYLEQNNNEVKLNDFHTGVIPEHCMAMLNGLWQNLTVTDKAIKLPKGCVGVLRSIKDSQVEFEMDKSSQELLNEIAAFSEIEKVLPPDLNGFQLRPYQEDGLNWLLFLRKYGFHGILADDMGLGKTLQVITYLLYLNQKSKLNTSLVVVPTSLLFNWKNEINRFAPELSCMLYYGHDRENLIKEINDYQVVITTYGVVRNDLTKLSKSVFDTIVLDESQNIKNSSSKIYQAVRKLQSDFRICLTGTPIENHLGELWSQFSFLMPSLLGSFNAFRRKYVISEEGDIDVLKKLLFPFILRRKKSEVAKDLPEKVEQQLLCEMTKEQSVVYNEVKETVRQELYSKINENGLNQSKIHVLECLLRLRQVACHAKLVNQDHPADCSGKLTTLMSMVSEILAEGHKVLIFSQFTKMLALIVDEMKANEQSFLYLDGSTKNRQDLVDQFQESEEAIPFLISLKAGGTGLNLTAAEYVFIFDPWWNPAVENQAIDRAHRIGQDKTVFSYRLIAKDTVEEKICLLKEHKEQLSDQILNNEKSVLQSLSKEDLDFLFQ